MIQLYIHNIYLYMYFFRFFSMIGFYKILYNSFTWARSAERWHDPPCRSLFSLPATTWVLHPPLSLWGFLSQLTFQLVKDPRVRKLVTAQGHRSHPDSCFILPSYVVRGGISCHFGSMRSFASVQWAFGENYSLGGFLFV